MQPDEFLRQIAANIVSELAPNDDIKRFVRNPDVIGAFAESSVRSLVARCASPLRVATGAVISPELCAQPESVPQVDTILWQPSPVPAVFTAGDFALVPRGNVFAVLEIKRSCYSGVGNALNDRLSDSNVARLTSDWCGESRRPVCELIKFPFAGLGVICLRESGQRDSLIDSLIEQGRVVVLFDWTSGQARPNSAAVHRLMNFLALARLRAARAVGADHVNLDLLPEAP